MSEYGRKRLSHNRRAADRAITIGATRPVICDGEPPYGPWRDRPVADAHGLTRDGKTVRGHGHCRAPSKPALRPRERPR